MKPILVTGGARGLGAQICLQLACAGHDLVLHYCTRAIEALQVAELCRQQRVHVDVIQGDFSTQASLESFIERYLTCFSHTKGVVNNVGYYLIAPSYETSNSQWIDLFQTNFFAPVFLTQALLPSLRAEQGGIVNIGVTGFHAKRTFIKGMAYGATKAALLFYTLSLAKELALEGIRVNMVSPGYMENAIDLPELADLPFKRPATLTEVAHMVATLFAPESAYITGQNIEIAGAIGL